MNAVSRQRTVLYVENGVGFGGAVISLRAFLEKCNRERYAAILVHSLDEPKFESFKTMARTILLPKVRFSGGVLGWFGRKLNLDVLLYAIRLARIARNERIELIYLNNDFLGNLSGLIAGRLVGVPVVLHERDIPAAASRLAAITVGWASRYLAISPPVRRALIQVGAAEDRIRMVPEGLDLDLYPQSTEASRKALRQELGLPQDGHLVVLAGMVMGWKGQHVLIAAAPAILEQHPDTHFLIVGECPAGHEPYLAGLRESVASLGLEQRVSFLGYRRDIPLIMAASDVVVHASTLPEPFGRVIIEGMAVSRPVVATRIGAPPDIIEEGVTGFLVPPDNSRALSEVLCTLLNNPELCHRVGVAARKEALAQYSIQRHVRSIESVFEELLYDQLQPNASEVLR